MGKSAIYCLYDPSTMEARYVGKSVNPEGRLKTHIWDAKRMNCYPVHKWINKLLAKGITPLVGVPFV